MTYYSKKEFIREVVMRGLALSTAVREWVKYNGKEQYSEDDMIDAHRSCYGRKRGIKVHHATHDQAVVLK